MEIYWFFSKLNPNILWMSLLCSKQKVIFLPIYSLNFYSFFFWLMVREVKGLVEDYWEVISFDKIILCSINSRMCYYEHSRTWFENKITSKNMNISVLETWLGYVNRISGPTSEIYSAGRRILMHNEPILLGNNSLYLCGQIVLGYFKS